MSRKAERLHLEARCLKHLERFGPCGSKEMSEVLGISKTRALAIMNRLTSKGALSRSKKGGRCKWVKL